METNGTIELYGGEPLRGVPPKLRWPSNLFIGGTVNMDESTFPFSDKVLDRAFTLEFTSVDLGALFERRSVSRPEREQLLLQLQEILRPARRHFGYRTATELLDFVEAGGAAREAELLDMAIFSKVLPRIRGEEAPELQQALEQAAQLCERSRLRRSAEKLRAMQGQLRSTGLTKFWG